MRILQMRRSLLSFARYGSADEGFLHLLILSKHGAINNKAIFSRELSCVYTVPLRPSQFKILISINYNLCHTNYGKFSAPLLITYVF